MLRKHIRNETGFNKIFMNTFLLCETAKLFP